MANKYLEKIAASKRIMPGEEDYQKYAPKSTKVARGLGLASVAAAGGSLATTHKRPKLSKALGIGALGTYAGALGSAIYAGHKTSKGVGKDYKIVKKDKK